MTRKRHSIRLTYTIAYFFVALLFSIVIGSFMFEKNAEATFINPYIHSAEAPISETEIGTSGGDFKLSDAVVKTIEIVFGEDAESAKAVAFCESSKNPHAKSKISSATGLFQIIKGTWKGYKCQGDPENAFDNIVCAKRIYDAQGSWNTSGGWQASAYCHKQL